MSTFASLLPSLQAAFFSKPQPAADDEVKAQSEGAWQDAQGESASAGTEINMKSKDNIATASDRPLPLHSTSSASSAPSVSSEAEGKPAVPGLIWKEGRRVEYDTEGNVRTSKDGKRKGKDKRTQETEVRQQLALSVVGV